MKKFIAILIVLTCSFSAESQNVGINKTNPAQSLDVNGNVNVDGKIVVNGVEGTAGQVLQTTSLGATSWVDMSSYTKLSSYTQNGSFTVPAGVTKIFIEAWGAGGGGSSSGGGAGGAYTISTQNVTPGQTLTILTGIGGDNATVFGGAASNGTNTSISGSAPFSSFSVYGGRGADAIRPGYSPHFLTSGASYKQYPGQAGDANTFTYTQKNSTTYVIIRKYGDGGASGPDFTKRSQGETESFNESSNGTIEYNVTTFAPFPGGGGGGGFTGEDGADGMLVIWY